MPIRRNRLKRFRNPTPLDGEPVDFKLALRVAKETLSALHGASGAAIGGGLAMQLYGSTRATKDVDLIATALPEWSAKSVRRLSFGGMAYEVRGVPVDVLVREDHERLLYDLAAREHRTVHGLPVVTPQHLAVIKFLAGRPKDLLDLTFLAQHKLFKETTARSIIKEAFNQDTAYFMLQEFQATMDEIGLALKRERSKYE